MNNRYIIYVDKREKNSPVVEFLKKLDVEVIIKHMDIGDYLLSQRLCVERKTAEDFVSAIKTKRLFKQLMELRAYERPLFIIEGDLYQIKGVYPYGIKGAISLISVVYGVPILFTKNAMDTAEFLVIMAKQEQTVIDELSFHFKPKANKPSQEIERVLLSFPGIGPKLTHLLLKKYNTLWNIFNSSEKELSTVIGKKKSAKIKEILTREYK